MKKTISLPKILDESLIDEIFPRGQVSLIKRAIVSTEKLTPTLNVARMQLGNECSILLYGKDTNENVHFTMLSPETFAKLKKLKIKGV